MVNWRSTLNGFYVCEKWFKEKEYTNFECFSNKCKCVDYKKGRGMFNIEELEGIFSRPLDSVTLSPDLPKSLIPYGRIGDNIDRDNEFYVHVKKVIDPNISNTLFINFTGHCGPVAAALCENGVSSLIWNLKLDTDSIVKEEF